VREERGGSEAATDTRFVLGSSRRILL
jgi:hypothetical protein